jgi:hypothetical protein
MRVALETRLDRHETLLTKIMWNQSYEIEQATLDSKPEEVNNIKPLLDTEVEVVKTTQITVIEKDWRRTSSTSSTDSCDICSCKCHSQWSFFVSAWNNVLGTMSVRTKGNPLSPQACNDQSCKRRSNPMLTGQYYFPHWLAMRAIIFNLVNGPSPSVSLTLARIVSIDSDLFHYIRTGDCERIQKLLIRGDASPVDMVELSYGNKLNALLFALNNSQYGVCQLLLAWGAEYVLSCPVC